MAGLYVDAHCHVDRFERPMDVVRAAEAAGVVIVAVTELPSAYQRLSLRLGARPRLRLALGCHPLRAVEINSVERALFNRLIDATDYVGEVGLDGSAAGKATLTAQRRVFSGVLNHPRIKHKILTVHSRGAEQETIERLTDANVTAILHWYTGAARHIPAALDAGLWFSVNLAMLRSRAGQATIAALPKERVITETDGPWTKTAGRPCTPADIPRLIVALARLWDEPLEITRARVFASMATLARLTRG